MCTHNRWLIMIASLAFSYATPIDKMHRVRPLNSLFHPSIMISIIGQVIIHLGTMIYGVHLATTEMGPQLMKEVVRFHKRQDHADLAAQELLDDASVSLLWTVWTVISTCNSYKTYIC